MNKKELKALRRPFLRELFRKNRFSFGMTFLAAILCAAAELVISWLVKEVPDLISGDCPYSFGTLLLGPAPREGHPGLLRGEHRPLHLRPF